jgi:uncharacterized protein YndB with AHSA1/START domain
MPIRYDSERRWVELEFLVPGTPESVWRAIATGPGLSAWFTPTTVEERAGGQVTFDFGENASSSGTVTGWEPPFRFAYEEQGWSGKAPPLASEFVISSHAGGQCVVRIVHSLFTSSDSWDDEIEGFESGWRGFFEVLRVYLRDYPNQRAAAVRALAVSAGSHVEAWKRLATSLGVFGPNLGERRTSPAGAPTLAGQVEHVQQGADSCEVLVRLDEPAPGLALVGSHRFGRRARVATSLFLYGARASDAGAKLEAEWRRWLAALFPPSGAASTDGH